VASDDLRDALSVLYMTSAHLKSIGIDIPVRVIIYHRYRTYIMSRVGCCGLEHPQGRDLLGLTSPFGNGRISYRGLGCYGLEHSQGRGIPLTWGSVSKAAISFPPEADVERLLAMPTLSPSPLASVSPPSAGERLARCTALAALPSPPLPPPLHMPPPVHHRDDIPETEMPPLSHPTKVEPRGVTY
nr:hypothetical protein [Tanacetum cinerariifolium]